MRSAYSAGGAYAATARTGKSNGVRTRNGLAAVITKSRGDQALSMLASAFRTCIGCSHLAKGGGMQSSALLYDKLRT